MEGGSTTLKVKLWWVGARERKKKDIFGTFYFVQRKFFGHLCFMSINSELNTLSEYTYFYIKKKKKITSYTFLLVFKICRIPINSLWITLYELSIDIPLKRAIFFWRVVRSYPTHSITYAAASFMLLVFEKMANVF